ncbi:hypothetical protein HY771_02170 [Candidatus Uhrbacteria bacterium]|nr:hypothetical protein [Candidatus Uhrbacteria bacterium]
MKILFKSNIFSLLFLAIFLLNVYIFESSAIGILLLLAYLAVFGSKMGTIVARGETGPVRFWIGSLTLISCISLILTIAYYIVFIPKELVIILILLTPPFVDILHKRFGGLPFFERFHEVWKEHSHKIGRGVLLSFSLILILGFLFIGKLLNSQITDAVRSPWDRVDASVIVLMGLLLLLLFGLLVRGHERVLSLPAVSFVLFLFLSLVLFVFPIGYGFDSFIHKATEQYLSEFGTISPKPFYYIGQYSLTLFFHHGFVLPISVVDAYLVPILTALFLPIAWYTAAIHITGKKSLSALTLTGIFLIPLGSFIITTPQSLANLWTLLLILASAPYLFAAERPRFIFFGLIALTTLAIHPIAGLPAVLYFALLCADPERAPKSWKAVSKSVFGAIVILTSVILPLSFLFNAWLSGQKLFIKWSALNPVKIFSGLNLSLFFENKFSPFLDFVYLYGRNAFIILIIISVCAWWMYRKDIPRRTRAILCMIVALSINYLIMKTAIDFTFLIDYERLNYSSRLVPLITFFLIPFFILGLGHFLLNLRSRPISLYTSTLALLCAFALSAFYMTYPRHDAYETNRGFNVSAHDQVAVLLVEEWSAQAPYISLANQSVSAAAIEQIGFRYYGSLFFYPIPTGEPLYQYFLKMNEAPTREIAQEALTLVPMHGDVKTIFFFVNNYWWDAPRIIETAKTTADDWRAVGNGAVYVFKYEF